MIKRLTALTLAMLMLLNPMTAFAVSWSTVVTALNTVGSYSGDGVNATAEDGAVTVTGGDDSVLTDVKLNGDYSSYTFGGTLKIDGNYFDIYVYADESVAVNIGEDVNITTTDGVRADVEGGSLTVDNAGNIADNLWGNIKDNSSVTLINSGDISRNMVVSIKGSGSSVTMTNTVSGTIGGYMDSYIDGDNNTVIRNNAGTVEDEMYVSIEGSSNTVSTTNTGNVAKDIDYYITTDDKYADNNKIFVSNTGDLDCINVQIYPDDEEFVPRNNSVVLNNSGDIRDELCVSAYGTDNTISVSNSGDIRDELSITAYGTDNAISISNSGDIGSKEPLDEGSTYHGVLYAVASGENNSISISSSGTNHGSMGIRSNGEGNQIGVQHDGDVMQDTVIDMLGASQADVQISGAAGDVMIGTLAGGSVTFGAAGGVENKIQTLNGKDSKVILVVRAGDGSVVDPAVVEKIFKDSITDFELPEGTTLPSELTGGEFEIITTDADGEKTARYSIVNGKATLVEVYEKESAGVTYDDPAFWTAERIRHDKEEERKAAAIGGVTGSPYWIKQLYLGYMSLDLRLFDGEEQLLFKEYLSWQPDGSKLLTLRTKITDTSDLMMRLDGMVIKKLNQAGISTIAIVDGNGNPFMAYEVADLEGARAMYELGFEDYIVVGEATDDVMMIGADGQIVPIEGEKAEATPAA